MSGPDLFSSQREREPLEMAAIRADAGRDDQGDAADAGDRGGAVRGAALQPGAGAGVLAVALGFTTC